jgi:5-methyltetrahydrofolate--homocysteine methyltransferase
VRIAQEYDNGVIHVLDASRSVTVAGNLLNKETKPGFLSDIKTEYEKLKNDFGNKRSAKVILPFEQVQKNKFPIDWEKFTPVKPAFTGIKVFEDYDLNEIYEYLDWQPFFIAWEMHGKFPQILSDEKIGVAATKLYEEAQVFLKKLIKEKWLTARGVVGFWEANAISDDTVEVKDTDGKKYNLEFLRQQIKKAPGQPNMSLADFVKPSPTPTSTSPVQDSAEAPSRGEGVDSAFMPEGKNSEPGYHWADPSVYGLLSEFAKENRSTPTPAEEKLWTLLKTKKLGGHKFRRQHIIGSYITDFVCLDKRLVIEIDGLIHQLPGNKESDEMRTHWLNSVGFKVIRFSNEEVLNNTDNVISSISSALKDQPGIKESSDLSSPFGGQGADYIGAFAVSMHGLEPHIERFQKEFDDYSKIMLQALADRLAEAFAELLHERTRKEFWGYAKEEQLSSKELIEEKYAGIRPAPGYPACPDHTEKYKLFELLDATKNAGITLTESLAMYPAPSVCGWYFANPESKYFGIGKIAKDQVEDYARRKNMSVEEVERWLRPQLDYDA